MDQRTLTTYLKLCTEFYDLELKDNLDAKKALEFYTNYALQAHGPILEPMCGTGRFLIPILQAGYDIEGFDASSYMLDALKQKYAKVSTEQAPVWQQFVQDFTGNKQYNLIFIPYGSWGLITNQEDAKNSLEKMYRHLAPGGKFVLEIETIASVPEQHGIWRRGVHTRDDNSRIAVNTLTSYDPITQIFRSICRYELILNGLVTIIETEDFQQYAYRFDDTCDEMGQLLQNTGFSQIKKYKDFSKTSAINSKDSNAPIIIYECVK